MNNENKMIIYQVFTRLFGNNNNHCVYNGDITANGCGKMAATSPSRHLEKSGNWVLPISGIQALSSMQRRRITVASTYAPTTPPS